MFQSTVVLSGDSDGAATDTRNVNLPNGTGQGITMNGTGPPHQERSSKVVLQSTLSCSCQPTWKTRLPRRRPRQGRSRMAVLQSKLVLSDDLDGTAAVTWNGNLPNGTGHGLKMNGTAPPTPPQERIWKVVLQSTLSRSCQPYWMTRLAHRRLHQGRSREVVLQTTFPRSGPPCWMA